MENAVLSIIGRALGTGKKLEVEAGRNCRQFRRL